MLTQIESLLKYANRFYERQFLTRKNNNSALLTRFEQLIDDYFSSDVQGLLTVQSIAAQMNLSPN
jgi:AraC family transcriptional activator of pobA